MEHAVKEDRFGYLRSSLRGGGTMAEHHLLVGRIVIEQG